MKTSKFLKNLGMMAIAVTVAAGCASTQQEQQQAKPAAAKAEKKMEKKGPSAAALAIAAAEAARKKAASVGGEWRDTGKLIKKAKKALKAGDEAKALKLANKARIQGELGYAKILSERELLSKKNASYTVSAGDNLWSISAQDSVYGNPYQWPLIYKTNRHQINDADLIYPGQELEIDQGASAADVAAAVNHAKTRGAWAIGVTEDSDKAYLGE